MRKFNIMAASPGIISQIKHYTIAKSIISRVVLLMGVCSLLNSSRVEAVDSSSVAYSLQVYNSINSYRAKHTIPALRWDRQLSESAENVAAGIVVESPTMENTGGFTLFINPGTTKPPASLVAATWYNESVYYNFNNPIYNRATHNFTQMIWKDSTSVGIGTFTHGGYTSVVALFRPAGNVQGAFRQNVTPVKSKYRVQINKKRRFMG